MQLDEGCGLRVIQHPSVPEFLIHIDIEEPSVLGLHIVVALENDGDENLQEHQIDHEHEADEENVC